MNKHPKEVDEKRNRLRAEAKAMRQVSNELRSQERPSVPCIDYAVARIADALAVLLEELS